MVESWDEWYKIAEKYAFILPYGLADIKRSFTTSEGDPLGEWLHLQKCAYKNRRLPKEKWNKNIKPLAYEQVKKLEGLNIIWNVQDNKHKVKLICQKYFKEEEFQTNKQFLIRIPAKILEAKIKYCIRNNLPLIENNALNHIFYVSAKNLEIEYGITLDELFPKQSKKKVI